MKNPLAKVAIASPGLPPAAQEAPGKHAPAPSPHLTDAKPKIGRTRALRVSPDKTGEPEVAASRAENSHRMAEEPQKCGRQAGAGDGIRTHDVQLGKLTPPGRNPLPRNDLQKPADSMCAPVRAPNTPDATADPDLAAVVSAWPGLPEALRAGILAMVKAAGQARPEESKG